MPHQQKLVHIQDITGVAPGGGGTGIIPGLQYDANNEPALSVYRHKTTVEVYGADPGGDFRWFTTVFIANTFTLWYMSTNGGYNLHIVTKIFHSICFDISSAEQPY
jgi:hypothetical protein